MFGETTPSRITVVAEVPVFESSVGTMPAGREYGQHDCRRIVRERLDFIITGSLLGEHLEETAAWSIPSWN
jgi:hypothetical protein